MSSIQKKYNKINHNSQYPICCKINNICKGLLDNITKNKKDSACWSLLSSDKQKNNHIRKYGLYGEYSSFTLFLSKQVRFYYQHFPYIFYHLTRGSSQSSNKRTEHFVLVRFSIVVLPKTKRTAIAGVYWGQTNKKQPYFLICFIRRILVIYFILIKTS